jgi:lipoprotein signal peptidase
MISSNLVCSCNLIPNNIEVPEISEFMIICTLNWENHGVCFSFLASENRDLFLVLTLGLLLI